MSNYFVQEEPLRLGAPPYAAVQPLLCGLQSHPEVRLETLLPHELHQRLCDQSLDAALLPPLLALRCPLCRAVPGIGVASEGTISSERLLLNLNRAKVCIIGAYPEHTHVAELGAMLLAEDRDVTGQKTGRPEVIAIRNNEDRVDAVALGGDAGRHIERSPLEILDLGQLWHSQTGLPHILWLWIGKFRAPYPRLRKVLALAHQRGIEDFAECVQPEPVPHLLRYRLASLEAEALREFQRLAVKHGFSDPESRFDFC